MGGTRQHLLFLFLYIFENFHKKQVSFITRKNIENLDRFQRGLPGKAAGIAQSFAGAFQGNTITVEINTLNGDRGTCRSLTDHSKKHEIRNAREAQEGGNILTGKGCTGH